jgi:hypothetical protein
MLLHAVHLGRVVVIHLAMLIAFFWQPTQLVAAEGYFTPQKAT